MTDLQALPLSRAEKWTIEEVRNAHIEARAAATVKMQGLQSGLSENEQAIFLAIEQQMGLDKETCIKNLRMHNHQVFDSIVNEEYQRNLDTLRKKPNWIAESYKAFEAAVIPVKANDAQAILGWGYHFKDEVTKSKCPPIREIIRAKPIELPDVLLLTRRQRFIQEVRSKYDRKIFEHDFDRLQVGWNPEKHGSNRYFSVKFMLRTPWCRVTFEK